MGSRRLLFRTLYRLGLTPWDGHPLANSLTTLIESGSIAPTTALDLGCGTGDNAIYLAEHAWQVPGAASWTRLRPRASPRPAAERRKFIEPDVTQLRSSGIGDSFDLVIDSGCLHGMNDEDRDGYVREVTAVTATGGRLLIVAFVPGSSWASAA